MKKTLPALGLSLVLLTGACSVNGRCIREDNPEASCAQPFDSNGETPAYFAFDSSTLDKADQAHLDKIADHLMDYPEEKILIKGYTDNTGPASYNLTLSQKRAQAAAIYLKWRGISAQRITVQGMGASDFVASNTTPAGREKNRRIEIFFYR